MTGSMPCPRCTSALHVAQGENGGAVSACLSCGGVWLDVKTSNDLKNAFGAWAARVADHAASTAQQRPDTESSRALACPACGQAMRKARVPGAGFEIDRCEPHGTFYDRGELSAALRIVQAPRQLPARRMYGPAAVGLGVVAAGAGAATAIALSQDPNVQAHLQANAQSISSSAADAAEIGLEVVDVGLEVASEVNLGDLVDVGGAVVEGGASIFGFVFEALGSLDF